jgi:multiple sugar transport system permease protein
MQGGVAPPCMLDYGLRGRDLQMARATFSSFPLTYKHSLTYKQQKVLTSILFLSVPLVLLLVFTYVPALNMFYLSFSEWDGFGSIDKFVGLDNYIAIFTRPEYFSVFWVSLYYFVGAILQLAIALYFAMILSFNVRFKNFFKGVLFFPYMINGVAIGFTFLVFFQPNGVFDTVLKLIGFGSDNMPLWLGDHHLVNISLAAVSIWRYMGFDFVMFLGAIQSIPSDIYEASELDGASRWQQLLYIILPGIRPIIALCLILAVGGALSVFEIPFIMTNGGNGSSTFVLQTVNTAFRFSKFGLASAMAVVLLLFTVFVTVIQNGLLNRKEKRATL